MATHAVCKIAADMAGALALTGHVYAILDTTEMTSLYAIWSDAQLDPMEKSAVGMETATQQKASALMQMDSRDASPDSRAMHARREDARMQRA